MTNSMKRPIGFFLVSTVILAMVSVIDYGLFHFLTDFFSITIGFMIFLIVINSKVYTEKSGLLILATSYLYISCFDFYHMVTVYNVTEIGVNLNESYLAFTFARLLEALVMIFVYQFVRSSKRSSYIMAHVIGTVILVAGIVLIRSGLIEAFMVGSGQSVFRFSFNYVIIALFLVGAYLVYNSKLDYIDKSMLALVLVAKAISLIIHTNFRQMGDLHQITAMILRYISYGGLYVVFVKELVGKPYENVYRLFSSEEKRLVTLSERDSLTGVFNHSMTFKNIERMILKVGKEYDGLCVILFDIDNFKQINDSYGHIKGDNMIIKFTSILNDLYSPNKMVGRYGGDEFVLAIPNCNEDTVVEVFDEIKKKLIAAAYEDGVSITFSAGVVTWRIGDNATDLIRKADIKMYESKDKGKNQYSIWKHDVKNNLKSIKA